jgi:hypothetical protein
MLTYRARYHFWYGRGDEVLATGGEGFVTPTTTKQAGLAAVTATKTLTTVTVTTTTR